MAIVDKYLKELVQNNRRVIIPDLGAFLLKENPAATKTVIFSSFLRYNDGFLEESIAQKAKLNKNESSTVIKKFIDEINKAVRNKKRYEIAGFGHFALDEKGTVQFYASEDLINITPAETIVQPEKKIEPIIEITEPKPIIEKLVTEPIKVATNGDTPTPPLYQQPVNPVIQTQQTPPIANVYTPPVTPINEKTTTSIVEQTVKTNYVNDNKSSKKRSGLLWVIIFLLVVIVFLLTMLYLCVTNSDLCFLRKKTPFVEQPIISTPLQGQQINTDSSKILATQSTSSTRELHYYVIANCFSEKLNAEIFLKDMLEKGYNQAVILPKIGELYPVSIGKSVNSQEAENMRKAYNDKYDEEAWLHRTY